MVTTAWAITSYNCGIEAVTNAVINDSGLNMITTTSGARGRRSLRLCRIRLKTSGPSSNGSTDVIAGINAAMATTNNNIIGIIITIMCRLI